MMKFLTKAKTLSLLEKYVTKSTILPQLCFSVSELVEYPAKVKNQILERFHEPLIVRSSALNEDTIIESQAGKYLSVPNVLPKDVISAMTKVMNSYVDNNPHNEILIQPMLENIYMSGVLFTIDPNTGGNYFLVNYDMSGSTYSVTSGLGHDLQIYYHFHGHKCDNQFFIKLFDQALELMRLLNQRALDIEFAITSSFELYLLQVRPLVIKKEIVDYERQREYLRQIQSFLERQMTVDPFLGGNKTIYGVMPDWNPAEMIGIRPKPLALSLYHRIITDQVWSTQRKKYGYKDLSGYPLVFDLCCMPYVDTRVSFYSFIPAKMDDVLTKKLVEYYLDNFSKHLDKHDKIEFDIVFSCYTFDLSERIRILSKYGFDLEEQNEIMEELKNLTNHIINPQNSIWRNDLEQIKKLEERYQTIINSDLNVINKIYWLLEDCKNYGSISFAGLARCGFIAIQILRSLVKLGVLSNKDYEDYELNLHTIGSDLIFDLDKMSYSEFIMKYGHLRPGTYEITSPRYDHAYNYYFSTTNNEIKEKKMKHDFTLTNVQYDKIEQIITENDIECNVDILFDFIRTGIEAREYSKFAFTKNISYALELIAQLGEKYGFTREDMSYVDISTIDKLYMSSDDVRSLLEKAIGDGKDKYVKALAINLPPIITNPPDIYSYSLLNGTPNFITLKKVIGNVCTNLNNIEAIKDPIIIINAADPGYDWIFTHKICAFITAYGGANSHMAIRAGELGIPAVIGTGEKLFMQLEKSKVLQVDCANKKVEIIS